MKIKKIPYFQLNKNISFSDLRYLTLKEKSFFLKYHPLRKKIRKYIISNKTTFKSKKLKINPK